MYIQRHGDNGCCILLLDKAKVKVKVLGSEWKQMFRLHKKEMCNVKEMSCSLFKLDGASDFILVFGMTFILS